MAKRTASSDLNHENWDQEEEPEDAGSFSRAADDIIKKRVIKVAKRRNPIAMTKSEEETPSVFAGFTFTKTTTPSTNNPLGLLSNLANKDNKTNGTTNPEKAQKTPEKTQKTPEKTHTDDYYAKLKGLNESVLSWISKKVNENPLINLQPVFKDYEKYFDELEKSGPKDESITEKTPIEIKSAPTFNFGSGSGSTPTFNFASTSNTPGTTLGNANKPSALIPTFNFGKTETKPEATFSFGGTSTASTTKPQEKFSFGSPTLTTSSGNSAKFSFGANDSGKFSFGSNTTSSSTSKSTEEVQEEDEDQPPKNEFKPVVENDYIYTIRCKVFVKKDGNYGDRGVGNLYLKKVPNTEKVQLIVRADTSLGNLLCNFILSENIPMQRMGKKDVMLVCLPTPETKPPPVPILLRVKTSEDADDLLNALQKYKK